MINATSPILAVLLQGAQPQALPPNSPVVDQVTECRKIADPAERLACFDKASATLEQKTESREVVVVEREEIKKAERGLFGLTLPKISIFGKDEGSTEGDLAEITSTITSIKPAGYAKWQFGLADGSVWTMIETNQRMWAEKGDSIVIRRAALGSFMGFVDGDKRGLRLKRES